MAKDKNEKPTAIRLGNLKPELQSIAFEEDRSMGYIVRKACKEFIEKYKNKK